MINIKNFNVKTLSYYFLLTFLIFSGISISASQIALGFTIILFIIACLKDRYLLHKTGFEIYILPFIIISFILALLSPEIINNLLYIKDFWLLSALLLAYFLHDSQDRIKKTFYLIVIIIIFQSIIIFLQIHYKITFINDHNIIGIFPDISADGSMKIRGGFLGMHLVFSCYLMLIAMPVIYTSLFAKNEFNKIKRLAIILTTLASFVVLIIIRSRAIIISLPFATLPLFFVNKKFRLWGLLIMIFFGFLIILLFIFYGQDQLTGKINGNILNSNSAAQRIKIWKTAIKVWQKNPIIGSGGGNYINEFKNVIKEYPDLSTGIIKEDKKQYINKLKKQWPKSKLELRKIQRFPEIYFGMVTHAHNDYLNQLARKGIIGFLAYIYMLFGIFKFYVANLKYVNDKFMKGIFLGLFASYCVFLIASLFQCFFTDEENLVMLWFTIGLAAAIVKIEKSAVKNDFVKAIT
jgi:O-antigen ligase